MARLAPSPPPHSRKRWRRTRHSPFSCSFTLQTLTRTLSPRGTHQLRRGFFRLSLPRRAPEARPPLLPPRLGIRHGAALVTPQRGSTTTTSSPSVLGPAASARRAFFSIRLELFSIWFEKSFSFSIRYGFWQISTFLPFIGGYYFVVLYIFKSPLRERG